MKRIVAFLVSVAVLVSIAVPVSVNAATAKATGLRQIKASETSAEFEWSPVFGKDVRYEIQLGYSKNDLSTVRGTDDIFSDDTHYEANNLSSGKSYYARVRAYADNSYGEWSDTLEIVTIPKAVESFVQTGFTANSASFTWKPSDGATSYRICENVNNTEKVLAAVTGTSSTIKGFKNTVQPSGSIYVTPVRQSASFSAFSAKPYMWDVEEIDGSNIRLTPKKMSPPTISALYTALNLCEFTTQRVPCSDDVQYEAYNSKGKKVYSGTDSSPSLGGTHGGEFYSIRVRAISKLGSKIIGYGEWSDKKYFGYNLDLSAKKVSKKKAIKANWKKFKGADDYVVSISTSGKGGFKKAKITKKTTLKIKKYGKKKLKKKKTYYIKVIARKKLGKKVAATASATYKVK
jgi:hypothetical protein